MDLGTELSDTREAGQRGSIKERFPRFFPRALAFSPERMAGQTACPEGAPARARKA